MHIAPHVHTALHVHTAPHVHTVCAPHVRLMYAELMQAAAARPQAGQAGQAGPYGSRTGVRPAAAAGRTAARRGGKPPTLGEILVARLQDEPSAASLVWGKSPLDRFVPTMITPLQPRGSAQSA